ncbi:bifunctional rhamnulose-1-phosphate aldolase/short-chain dehydrogenase [Pseudoalteromonas sp. Angola-30]|uniref:bifunctional rhamnulose-1-phosphate aldolase/short-chain dehydrogenase n=1 Tax=Pseudoalteromonas sp. Angola-30 TaxID=3025341 RepID=UPI00235A1D39|nr:bifunctional rhamnulose-1-phosphate aldolase/short-chain dehydrogenase [Pseudoalteromonas sp. Angola-30]MDC9526797.1 bifunctional rhamnulose-1-phosphate aldolase/short-chain dehydrogenase [Pseudoalteromonas sp. Angola-30]
MPSKSNEYKHVNYSWDDAVVENLSPVESLIYRSNILGADQRITNTGGGNTSAKAMEVDPLTGESVEVLWVKGSGGDLRTSKPENFSSLYMSKLIALQDIYHSADEVGVKTQIEDDMVDMYRHATFNLNPRATSIDTPLHAFIPYKHVDHMHPNSVIAVAASKNSKELTQKIFGDELVWTEWQRPGFDLGLKLQTICKDYPDAKGAILAGHGVINWANDNKECYDLSLDIIEKAARYIEEHDKGEMTFGGQKYAKLDNAKREEVLGAVLPYLRGLVSGEKKMIGTVQSDDTVLRFVNSADAPRLADLGTSCPDHFLRTKIKPLYVDWNPETDSIEQLKTLLSAGVEQYKSDYSDYYEQCKRHNSPAQRASSPSVCLIPGVGMVAWGKNKSESRVTAEFYNCAIEVMRGAEAIDEYAALPQQEAFDIEYWLLEEAKLQRMPKEAPLARDVVVVIGAGDGIGKETAFRVAKEGAHVVCADLRVEAAQETADELTAIYGQGIGVAGTGISSCGPAIAQGVDITDRESVKKMFKEVTLAYGGIDKVIVTAGVFLAPGQPGMTNDQQFDVSFAVNVKGGYIVGTEANEIWKAQGFKGALVLTTSVNAAVSKKGSLAYDTSKAAANHLVRELAVELSPLVNVNGLAPATVVKGSTMFPRDRVIASLTKYNVEFTEQDSDDELRDKLANFYAQRTLTKQPITPEDQAEAAYLMVSGQLSKTTGQIISVDGGLHEAFLR